MPSSDEQPKKAVLEGRGEHTEQQNTRLDQAPDAVAVRNSDQAQVKSALELNQDNWRSQEGHFAIVDNGQTIAKQNGVEQEGQSEKSDKLSADTSTLRAIRQDDSLPDDTRFLATQYQLMRDESKVRGLSTEVIDTLAGEQLAREILAKRNDAAGLSDAGTFNVSDIVNARATGKVGKDQLIGNQANDDIQPLANTEKSDVREVSNRGADKLDQKLLIDGTKLLIDESLKMGPPYDPKKIEALHIPKDDIGTAYALFWLGPDIVKALGSEQSRTLGRRSLVFGVMPLLGAYEKGEEEFRHNLDGVMTKGATNATCGALISAALHKAPGKLLWGLAVVGTGALAVDQLGNPKYSERNSNLQKIYDNVGSMSNDDFLKSGNYAKTCLGESCYDAIFDTTTGGLGLPVGLESELFKSGLGAQAVKQLEKFVPKAALEGLGEQIANIGSKLGKLPKLFDHLHNNEGRQPATADGTGDNTMYMKRHPNEHWEPEIDPNFRRGVYENPKPINLDNLFEHPRVAEMLKRMKLADGNISKADGEEICDIIAESVRHQNPKIPIDKKNIAFAVVETMDGKKQIVFAISGEKMPGAPVPTVEFEDMKSKPAGCVDKFFDSEYKILSQLVNDMKGDAQRRIKSIAMFSEQKPCDSCGPAIQKFKANYLDHPNSFPEVRWLKFDSYTRNNYNFEKRKLAPKKDH